MMRYDGKRFTTLRVSQGLVNDNVWKIFEDRSGKIWFSTLGGGVSCYDGTTFKNYTKAEGLAGNHVRSIVQDRHGALWFGTFGDGVSRYDGTTFTNYTTTHGLPSNNVTSIYEDKSGNLWFGTNGGVSRYNGTSFTTYTTDQGLVHNNVRVVIGDRMGNLWFGTNGGVSRYDGHTFTNYTTAQGLVNNFVNNIFIDRLGGVWFATVGGVSHFDGSRCRNYTTAQGLGANFVTCITEDKSGNMWFATRGGGVSRLNGRGFTTFTKEHGLAENLVRSISEDASGNLWFGIFGGGVSRYDGKRFINYTTAHGLVDDFVRCIVHDRMKHCWIGTEQGLSYFDGTTFTNYTTAQGLLSNSITNILEDKSGTVWFGTFGGGLTRYDGKQFMHYTTNQGLSGHAIWSSVEDKEGILWFGTYGGGITRYDRESFVHLDMRHGLAGNVIRCIRQDNRGNLWCATDRGLSVLRAETIAMIREEVQEISAQRASERKNHTKKDGKPVHDSIMIPTNCFQNFTTDNGLPDDFITQIAQMPDGRMVIGTRSGGIMMFAVSADFKMIHSIEIFNMQTGYPVSDILFGQNSLLIDRHGMLWAGTGNAQTGLVRFDEREFREDIVRKRTEVPPVMIRAMSIGDMPISWYTLQRRGVIATATDSARARLEEYLAHGKSMSQGERDTLVRRFGGIRFDSITPYYPLPMHIELPYEHNKVTFDFIGIETGKPWQVWYQYILEGYDKEWSPMTQQTNAVFGNISEGTYTFKVKARGVSGVWSEPIIYTFRVLPPWYRTWWAYSVYGIAAFLSIYVYTHWRERALQAEKEALEEIVKERTKELTHEKKKSDDLLLNILPYEIAEELKQKGEADAKLIEEATVLFTDFKGFTQLSEQLSPQALVNEIHQCFSAFDGIMQKYHVEKIKTIGDAYMAVGGLPIANTTHAEDVVSAALEIQQYMEEYYRRKSSRGEICFEIRIGVHTGPVIAGIVGIKKFAYDIWGDTVNTASRMESSGEVGKINISGSTYALIQDKFRCEYRGKVTAKGKGDIDMYFVEGRKEVG